MKVDFIRSKNNWEEFLEINNGTFLQSNYWYQFKKDYQEVFQIEARENDNIVGLCQFFKEKTPFGNYFYIPHGPVVSKKNATNIIIEKVKEIAKKQNVIFIRIEPLFDINIGINSFKRIQPQKTLILDISKSNEDIFRSFNSSTRRNINTAKNNKVIIKEEDNISAFYNLLLKTKTRQKFNSYNEDYFTNLLNKCRGVLSCAYHKNNIIAANIVLYHNKTAYCLHSATDHSHRKLKGSNLLRYTSIIKAKEAGLLKFDNWGIDEKRFPGVTSFKKGFGGSKLIYPEGKDIVIKKVAYNIYKYFSLLRKKT